MQCFVYHVTMFTGCSASYVARTVFVCYNAYLQMVCSVLFLMLCGSDDTVNCKVLCGEHLYNAHR